MEQEKTAKSEIRWKAEEYVYHKKSVDWYWYFGLISIVLVVSAIWLHNTLFAFIIGIGAFTMLLYANKHPRELEYVASKNGISYDDISYSYRDILFFFIVNDKKQSEEKLLLLRLKKATSSIVVIPLGDTGLDELRTFLLSFTEEQEIPVPFTYTLTALIGF